MTVRSCAGRLPRSAVARRIARSADRISDPHDPAAGERELVVGEAERGIERDGALEIALGAGQVPAVEVPHSAKVGAVGLERLGGGAGQSDADLVAGRRRDRAAWRRDRRRGAGRRHPRGRPPGRRPPGCRVATSNTRAARCSESPAGVKSPSTTVQTPDSRASRRAISRPMSSPTLRRWRASRSCSRSWSTTVRSFHWERLSPSMLTLPSRSQSTERSSRRLSNGSTRIEWRGLTPRRRVPPATSDQGRGSNQREPPPPPRAPAGRLTPRGTGTGRSPATA